MADWIVIIVALAAVIFGLFWRKRVVAKLAGIELPTKKELRPRKLATSLTVIAGYIFLTSLITLIFGPPEHKAIEVSLVGERVNLFGLNVTNTIILTWVAMAFLIVGALILRLTVISKFKDKPEGAQNILEIAVETAISYTHSMTHGLSPGLSPYIFTLMAYLVACAGLELFGLRTPASDLTITAAMALMTFIIFNYYGIKVKGFGGRLKSLGAPSPIFILRVVCDCALPVSMACRLFGNMLGGMIVLELLYMALGNYAVGIPGVLGLYFNAFHPLIQAFIFVTLTLAFTNEAVEEIE